MVKAELFSLFHVFSQGRPVALYSVVSVSVLLTRPRDVSRVKNSGFVTDLWLTKFDGLR